MFRIKRFSLIVLMLAATGGAFGLSWWLTHRERAIATPTLYGNVDLRQVDLRQVDLPFNDSGRIAAVRVQEGDRVRQGQVLARLDTSRLVPRVAEARAQVAAQRAIVERLRNGSRPERIAQARANVAAAKADLENARRQYERLDSLVVIHAASQENLDNLTAALEMAEARLTVTQNTLDLAVAGPRKEDVAQAAARLAANEAQLALLRQELADARLVAPVDAVVRTRIMEPGEMASPQQPVFSLAITDPKWVRAYAAEPDLGKLDPGMVASVRVDSFSKRRFAGWVGFISPVAEFTPKAVQTEELQTSLVYEVRVFVKDPGDELRLGMPATVHLPRHPRPIPASAAPPPTAAAAPKEQHESGSAPAGFGRDLRKTFRRGRGETVVALDGVSLEAKHGTPTALVDPDGAGKTTFLRMIAG